MRGYRKGCVLPCGPSLSQHVCRGIGTRLERHKRMTSLQLSWSSLQRSWELQAWSREQRAARADRVRAAQMAIHDRRQRRSRVRTSSCSSSPKRWRLAQALLPAVNGDPADPERDAPALPEPEPNGRCGEGRRLRLQRGPDCTEGWGRSLRDVRREVVLVQRRRGPGTGTPGAVDQVDETAKPAEVAARKRLSNASPRSWTAEDPADARDTARPGRRGCQPLASRTLLRPSARAVARPRRHYLSRGSRAGPASGSGDAASTWSSTRSGGSARASRRRPCRSRRASWAARR